MIAIKIKIRQAILQAKYLSQNIIDNLLRIDLNGDAHFYEISNAINYHIKYCTVLPNEDNIELLAPTPTNNGNTLGQNISLINVVDKSTNWQLVLEELLYKLADGFDEMVFLSDSTSSVKLSNVKKKNSSQNWLKFYFVSRRYTMQFSCAWTRW